MLIADLKGKLSLREARSEDFLTSTVFSAFRYSDVKWLDCFLSKAHRTTDAGKVYLPHRVESPEYLFWPWFPGGTASSKGAEPDVVILSGNAALVVEAKFLSGKSGEGVAEAESGEGTDEADRKIVLDQLAREYFVGRDHILGRFQVEDFYLIYLTRDVLLPTHDIEDAITLIAEIEPGERDVARERIYWSNWQQAYLAIEAMSKAAQGCGCPPAMCLELLEFLEKRELCPFQGFRFLGELGGFLGGARIAEPQFYRRESRRLWRFLDDAAPLRSDLPTWLFYRSDPRQ